VPSYAAVIGSVLALTLIAWTNGVLSGIRSLTPHWLPSHLLSSPLGQQLLLATEPIVPSWRHFAVLAAALALAVAATLYLFCPSQIKEFTMEQWRYIARRPAFEYHAASWELPIVRVTCLLFYALGGATALVLLIDTFLRLITLLIDQL
jgi:hypothetical protein